MEAGYYNTMFSTLDALVSATDKYDFGLSIFTPDDGIESRGEESMPVRDNVLLELGLFLGRLTARLAFPGDLRCDTHHHLLLLRGPINNSFRLSREKLVNKRSA